VGAGGAAAARLEIRPAVAADIEFIVATERLPGFEQLTARWSADQHRAAMDRADTRYLVGGWAATPLAGFALLQPLDDVHEGAKLKRIAVTRPGEGFGRPFLNAVIDWVFESTASDRLWLDVFTHNGRARHVYLSLGFREDGLLRQAYRMSDGTRADRVIMSMLRSERPGR
jgi:diamine N-acetyltransferase